MICQRVTDNPQTDINVFVPVLQEVVTAYYVQFFKQGANNFLKNVRDKKGIKVVRKRNLVFDFNLFNRRALDFVNQFAYTFAQSTLQHAGIRVHEVYALFKQELKNGLVEGDPQQVIAQRLQTVFSESKARTISQTESSRAVHAGQQMAARQSGIVRGKAWLASSDACPLCLSLDAKGEIPVNEPFTVQGTGPYSVVMHPPAHPHCFCTYLDIIG